ncbi:LysR substrate-binding domain-containing protein [Paraburkholderia sp. GAS348]|uniref:LysR substrate-binding domain-containing protein n=1 Tax=Paraburkholderia sp. GAS348 TaxID=3035132 RepID=UPI003D1A1F65
MLAGGSTAGLGIALIPRPLIKGELRRGVLVPMCDYDHPSMNAYCLIFPDDHSENPALVTFREWLESETLQNQGRKPRKDKRTTASIPVESPSPYAAVSVASRVANQTSSGGFGEWSMPSPR